jgi:hypothetical protein
MRDDDLLMLTEIILNTWAGGEPNGDDFIDREENPEGWEYISKLAQDNMKVIEELASEGGLERLIADHLQQRGGEIHVRNSNE